MRTGELAYLCLAFWLKFELRC